MMTKKILLTCTLFLIILTIPRLLWLYLYVAPDQPHAVKGTLDLRQGEAIKNHSIRLEGEWEFYPDTLLEPGNEKNSWLTQYIRVPGDWKTSTENGHTYGFGSYRLRILVEPDAGRIYGLHLPDAHASSKIYVNGQLLGGQGKPAEDRQHYIPSNAPYTAYFTVEHTKEIELVIQVANFDHPLKGGLVAAPTFGLAAPFGNHQRLAEDIALIACIIYLFHAVYSVVLFFVGNKDRRLLYFALAIVCAVLGTLIGENLLFKWLPLSFEWGIKVLCLAELLSGYVLLQCTKHLLPDAWRTKWSSRYAGLCALLALAILCLPASYNLAVKGFYEIVMLVPCLLAVFFMYRTAKQVDKDRIFLLFSIIAAVNSLVWLLITKKLALDILSYPVDLVISLTFFAAYWFKKYFRLLDQSQQLAGELREADQLKDQFLATVAREVQQPLNSMLHIARAVKEREKSKLDKASAGDLDFMQTIGQGMFAQLSDLVDLERLKENRLTLYQKEVSVQAAAAAVFDMLRYMAGGKTIKLTHRIPAGFPLVRADEERLTQILFNLLHTALKHSETGEAAVYAASKDGWAEISVAGSGIEERFRRKGVDFEEQSAEHGGFGLELTICRQLVELHGGTLRIHTHPNEGAVFVFTLPTAGPDTQPETAASREPQQEAAFESDSFLAADEQPSATDPIRLLAVDDDPVNLKALESIFSTAPYCIATAANGPQALAMLKTNEWDAVIIDTVMPEMSGYELTRTIRESFSIAELPVLLLTARSQPEDIIAAFLSGANDYINKPIEGVELKVRVDTLTNLKRAVNKQLRLEAGWLQAQIQPHFLFNTLNTIASLGEIDPARMTHLLEEFGNYLQRSFTSKNLERLVPLEHELELLRSYLFIEKERFGKRLAIIWDIDPAIKISIPPLSIQPLVENAIRHGILKRIEGGTVRIRLTDQGEQIEAAIIDDGVGMDEETIRQALATPSKQDHGVGLYNTNRRLKQLYGQGLDISSQPGQGTMILFYLPKQPNT